MQMSPRYLTRKWDPDIADVLADVVSATKVSAKRLQSSERTPYVARARWVAWFILRQRRMTYPEIGRMTGGFDHSTVIHGIKQAQKSHRKLISRILGTPGVPETPKIIERMERPPAFTSEMMRREALFSEHIRKWRELCAEDLRAA